MSQEQREHLDLLLREGPLDIGGDLAQQRPLLDQLMTSHPLPPDVGTTRAVLGGVPVVLVELTGGESDAALLYLHGGAFALGTATAATGLAADLARRASARAISVDYRLAPEHPFPAAVHDTVAAYRALLGSGVPASRIALVGESAGGGLAIAALVAAQKAGLPQPSSAVVLSPWVDLTLSGDSITGKGAADPALSAAGLARRAADYLAGGDPADDRVSPLFADLSGLPPLLIQAGSNEILLDDATRLAARAAAADVAVTLEVTPAVPHVFQGFAAVLDEGDAALGRAGDFLRSHLRSAVLT